MRTVSLGIFMSVILFCSSASAHPPSKIEARFDGEKDILTAFIFHPVRDPRTHYVKGVEVFRNGEKVMEDAFDSQDDQKRQYVAYDIPDTVKGDKITIKAFCNMYGNRVLEITAGE